MMFQVIPCLQNRCVHLLHCVAQFHTEATEDIPLPRIVFGVNPRLHLLVVNDANTQRLLCVRGVEGRPCLLDLGEQLLPVRERVT